MSGLIRRGVTRLERLSVRRPVVAALLIAIVAAVIDLRAEREAPDAWNARAAQRQRLRWMSAYVTAYGRQYGRPAFYLDSVIAHLDSATAAQFNAYRTDFWGESVNYSWNERTFELRSTAGLFGPRLDRTEDSVRALWIARGDSMRLSHPGAIFDRLVVREEYWWPVEARGRRNQLGQYTRVPGVNEPMLIRAEPLPKTDRREPPPLEGAS